MANSKLRPYSFIRTTNNCNTSFLYGSKPMFSITNMNDNVASEIVSQLNTAFELGHEMTLKSLEKITKEKSNG